MGSPSGATGGGMAPVSTGSIDRSTSWVLLTLFGAKIANIVFAMVVFSIPKFFLLRMRSSFRVHFPRELS